MDKRKVYIICPVRNRSDGEEKKINKYVKGLEGRGYLVHLPYRDTNQNDEIGLRIVEEHETQDILWADEIHIWWNPTSRGGLADFSQARIVRYFKPELKIVLINEADIEVTRDGNGKVEKSYTNVILAMHFGLTSASTGADLLKAKEKAIQSRRKS